MNEADVQRVQAARERAQEKAEQFFASLTPEQLEVMQNSAAQCAEDSCPPADPEQIGATFEANGWMSQTDYCEMKRVLNALQAGGPVPDGDFEMMLGFLRDADEAIVRAPLFVFLGELVKRTAPGPDRVARIEETIAPWREGPEDLDILYWAFVREALDSRLA